MGASPRGTYVVVAEALRQRIAEQQSGSLPSEAQLMAEFDISRTTVRRALELLARDGLIESAPGVGWRVVAKGANRRPVVERITEVIREDRLKVGDDFPSEAVLCERLSASRTAIRAALAKLEGRGVLEAVHGKGRTVRALPETDEA